MKFYAITSSNWHLFMEVETENTDFQNLLNWSKRFQRLFQREFFKIEATSKRYKAIASPFGLTIEQIND